ncbi:MAG: protein-L-isoaspartate(D-aspartate) O-methyltransferase [Xanthomonadales bacterium]|nr:protein-L-isoaspartate(D-aspartate) O-methyltransferase [Xanthomonadales bacterium]
MMVSSGIGMTSQRTRDRLVRRLADGGISDPRVLDAIASVPRHLFVDEALATRAYEDTALPIGRGQTISQPFVVALMTQALLTRGPLEKVLEVGTGSGYQAAVLSHVANQVFTIERIDELSRQARRRFRQSGLRNIRAKQGDGYQGWPQNAPYDGIMVTAAAGEVPEPLFEQLADGGILVAPVGPQNSVQRLLQYTRRGDRFEREDLGGVAFVPLLPGMDKPRSHSW